LVLGGKEKRRAGKLSSLCRLGEKKRKKKELGVLLGTWGEKEGREKT